MDGDGRDPEGLVDAVGEDDAHPLPPPRPLDPTPIIGETVGVDRVCQHDGLPLPLPTAPYVDVTLTTSPTPRT